MRPMEHDERGQTGSTHVSGVIVPYYTSAFILLGVCKIKVEAVKSTVIVSVIPDES